MHQIRIVHMLTTAAIALATLGAGGAGAQSLSAEEAADLVLQNEYCGTRAVEAYFDQPEVDRLMDWADTEAYALAPDLQMQTTRSGTVTEGSYRDGQYVNAIRIVSSPGYLHRGLYTLESCIVVPDYVDVTKLTVDPATRTAQVQHVTHWRLSEVGAQWKARDFRVSSFFASDDAYATPELQRHTMLLRYRPETGWERSGF